MPVELRRSSEFSLAELAAIFTAAYDEYVIPFAMDEARLSYMVEALDVDLTRSVVAVNKGRPIGLANLGLRRERAWLGGDGERGADRFARHRDTRRRAGRLRPAARHHHRDRADQAGTGGDRGGLGGAGCPPPAGRRAEGARACRARCAHVDREARGRRRMAKAITASSRS